MCCHTIVSALFRKKGATASLVSVLAPPALGMQTGQSAAAFQVINSVSRAYEWENAAV